MNNKMLIKTGNITSKALMTDNEINQIEEPKQLERNELKR